MTTDLFPLLLGDEWQQLAPLVRAMHGGDALIRARGAAEVDGARNFFARCSRRLLGLPEPGPAQALEVTIERRGKRETWTRRFARGQMRSVLDHVEDRALLSERLGPVTLRFQLLFDHGAIDWRLHEVRVMGLPLPRRFTGDVISRSGADLDRYTFHVDVRLPLLGQLVAYRGWLEIAERG
jgi:hypothetical protein